MPHQVDELDWFFRARQGRATEPAPDPDLTVATGAEKFGAARFRALQRRWESEGLSALGRRSPRRSATSCSEEKVASNSWSSRVSTCSSPPWSASPTCARLRREGTTQESRRLSPPIRLSTRSTTRCALAIMPLQRSNAEWTQHVAMASPRSGGAVCRPCLSHDVQGWEASRGVNDPVAASAGWPRACPIGSFTPRLAVRCLNGVA
jgi:hypothetical protein